MDKQNLTKLIDKQFTIREIAEELNSSFTNVRYWMRKYGLNTKTFENSNKSCKTCGSPLKGRQTVFCSKTCTRSICKCCGENFNHHYLSGGIYCTNKCQQKYQSSVMKDQIRKNIYPTTPTRHFVYSMLCEDFGNQCSICGLNGDNWNGKSIRLWVDHIDGYANNHCYSNFRLVCPNCDSQLDTCRAKNKGKGRKSLGVKAG